MAIETCFHVSTIATTNHKRHPFAHKDKLSVVALRSTFNISSISSFSASTGFKSLRTRRAANRLVCEAKNVVDQVAAVDEAGWNSQVLSNETPAVVYFWAPWCGPCRMIAPIMEELAKEYAGKIVCYKCNTDDCAKIASDYGIRSIPTILFFKNGDKKESVIGAVAKSALSATIEKYI